MKKRIRKKHYKQFITTLINYQINTISFTERLLSGTLNVQENSVQKQVEAIK